ncbi:MAG: hypothetical protein Q8936_11840 [Bacillota bacterium]|nr:hypothetical protein [Bacillota bacterium]
MFLNHLIGWMAAGFMLLSISYSILKRIKLKGKHLRFHCYFGYTSIILATIHAVANLTEISLSASLICLLAMLIIMVSGIIMRHFRNIFLKNIWIFRFIHIILAAICSVALVIHVVEYLI